MALPSRPVNVLVAALVTLGLAVSLKSQAGLTALPRDVKSPAANPTTAEKVELGRLLFWDPVLSGGKDVACATCHHPDFGYAEPLDISIGAHGVGLGSARRFEGSTPRPFVKRNSQTVLNTAFNGIAGTGTYSPEQAPMFWDVRVGSLEKQALEPIKALEEMRGEVYAETAALEAVVERLRAIPEYQARFARAFTGSSPVTIENLGNAIAAFERTLVATNAPFDRYMRGDTTAMTPLELRGMQHFQRAGCAACHDGPMFSDFKLHTIGVADNRKLAQSDTGAGGYAFRTPSLRNLKFTAPYMHNGTVPTLDAVLEFYDNVRGRQRGRGRQASRNPNLSRDDLDPLVLEVSLGGGRRDLVAFLEALSDPNFDRTIPDKVPSGLEVGGRIRGVPGF